VVESGSHDPDASYPNRSGGRLHKTGPNHFQDRAALFGYLLMAAENSAKGFPVYGDRGSILSISKSVRFEIFARDAFTCQYCGRRPPEVVLECDHIHPQSKGGGDEIINLITSCYDCNRGKRAKVISDVAPRPDADLAFLKVQQEIAEVKRFLAAKKKLDAMQVKARKALQETWAEYLTKELVPNSRVLTPWLNTYGPDEIERSIKIATIAYTSGRFGFDQNRVFNKLLPYIGAILRNRRADKENGVIQ